MKQGALPACIFNRGVECSSVRNCPSSCGWRPDEALLRREALKGSGLKLGPNGLFSLDLKVVHEDG